MLELTNKEALAVMLLLRDSVRLADEVQATFAQSKADRERMFENLLARMGEEGEGTSKPGGGLGGN